MRPIRIATWNLKRPRAKSWKRLPSLRRVLKQVDADIWVLTETHRSVALGDDYTWTSTVSPEREHEEGESWVTVWSRLPVESCELTSDSVRTTCARIRLPNQKPLLVFGSVLPWLGSPWREYPAVDGQAFAAALAAQERDWCRLRATHSGALFCLAGDLNQDLASEYYYGAEPYRGALKDALRRAGLEAVTSGGDDPVATLSAGQRQSIDHLCFCAASRAIVRRPFAWPVSRAPDAMLSDHYGVAVDMAAT